MSEMVRDRANRRNLGITCFVNVHSKTFFNILKILIISKKFKFKKIIIWEYKSKLLWECVVFERWINAKYTWRSLVVFVIGLLAWKLKRPFKISKISYFYAVFTFAVTVFPKLQIAAKFLISITLRILNFPLQNKEKCPVLKMMKKPLMELVQFTVCNNLLYHNYSWL